MPSKIEWTQETWNPIAGCTKCSPGCKNCYAERRSARLAHMGQRKYQNVVEGNYNNWFLPKWNNEVVCDESALDKPLHWRKPRRIFPCSMSDLFHPKVPFEFVDKVMFTIYKSYDMGHTFQILTKRAKRMLKYFSGNVDGKILELFRSTDRRYTSRHRLTNSVNMLPRVQIGGSISNQAEADEKIPILLQIPAAVRWLSIEPMLEKIKLNHIKLHERTLNALKGLSKYYIDGNTPYYGHFIDWVVVGGESGPGARPMNPDWARSIRDQCVAAGVPFFFKQMGGHPNKRSKLEDIPKDLRIREYPTVC